MKKTNPAIVTINASEARVHFGDVLKRVYRGEARLVVEKSGIPVAAIVSLEDLDRLSTSEETLKGISKEAIDRAMGTAGAWKDEDTDAMVSEIYRARKDMRTRPNVKL